MTRGNYDADPEFDEQIIEEYRRASAEGFAKSSAGSLRPQPREEPFRWPGIDRRRDTVALDRDELSRAVSANPYARERGGDVEADLGDTVQGDTLQGDTAQGDTVRLDYDRTQVVRGEFVRADSPPAEEQLDELVAVHHSAGTVQSSEPHQDQRDQKIASQPAVTADWALDVLGGELFVLPGTDLVVGRKPVGAQGVQTLLIEDSGRTLSKSHARLTLVDDIWMIEDLGSTNGSAILTGSSDEYGAERRLTPGRPEPVSDRFRIGTLHVRLRKLVRQ